MSHRMWLLVQWVDERNVFPVYGVVKANPLMYQEGDMQNGKQIFVQVNHESRRAQILRISDNKQYIKDQKDLMERQDKHVQHVLQICMQSIKEMKSETTYTNTMNCSQQYNAMNNPNLMPRLVTAATNTDNSTSESETEASGHLDSRVMYVKNEAIKPFAKTQLFNVGTGFCNRTLQNVMNHRRRSLVSSTPLPGIVHTDNLKLCFDQGTQTDSTPGQLSHMENLEGEFKRLYSRYISLTKELKILTTSKICKRNCNQGAKSDSDQNEAISYAVRSNDEVQTQENMTDYVVASNVTAAEGVNDNRAEVTSEVAQTSGNQYNVTNVKMEMDKPNGSAETIRVRRMSAQTTNTVDTNDSEMVPIGSGNAAVPARLLSEIDWKSYTTATRQLLQAVFPRRVLATHSLTGKPSPAFLDKPAKKSLDPKLVDDIIKTVASRCGVGKNFVRNSITIKCTDEAKLYRNRMKCRQSRKPVIHNEENVPPSTPSSDESNNE